MSRSSPDAGPSFDVLIPSRGPVLVNGSPLRVTGARSVHEAVLDMLHGHAVSAQDSVEATVNNQAIDAVIRLTVAPDGSSEIITEQDRAGLSQPFSAGEIASDQAVAGDIACDSASAPPGEGPGKPVRAAASPLGEIGGNASVLHDPVPDELWPEIEEIRSMATVGALSEALDLASSLRERLSAVKGAQDTHSLEALSLEAYIAHLKGDFRHALTLVLGVARVRCNQRDRRASQEVFRATAVWQQIDDRSAVLAHGNELLNMCGRLASWASESARLAQLAHHIEQRIQTMQVHTGVNFRAPSGLSGRPAHRAPWD